MTYFDFLDPQVPCYVQNDVIYLDAVRTSPVVFVDGREENAKIFLGTSATGRIPDARPVDS